MAIAFRPIGRAPRSEHVGCQGLKSGIIRESSGLRVAPPDWGGRPPGGPRALTPPATSSAPWLRITQARSRSAHPMPCRSAAGGRRAERREARRTVGSRVGWAAAGSRAASRGTSTSSRAILRGKLPMTILRGNRADHRREHVGARPEARRRSADRARWLDPTRMQRWRKAPADPKQPRAHRGPAARASRAPLGKSSRPVSIRPFLVRRHLTRTTWSQSRRPVPRWRLRCAS
jgi:hypothetical protein